MLVLRFLFMQLLLTNSFLSLFLSFHFMVFLLKDRCRWLSFFQPFVCAACSSCIVYLMVPSLLGKINVTLIKYAFAALISTCYQRTCWSFCIKQFYCSICYLNYEIVSWLGLHRLRTCCSYLLRKHVLCISCFLLVFADKKYKFFCIVFDNIIIPCHFADPVYARPTCWSSK
jgi:hypothetical protein